MIVAVQATTINRGIGKREGGPRDIRRVRVIGAGECGDGVVEKEGSP